MSLSLFPSPLSLCPRQANLELAPANPSYKDCRTGPKLKYAHSLRYLCAQRSDQDDTKRRSAARRAEKKAAAEAAREAGGGKAGDDDEDEEGGSEEEEQEQEEQERELQRLVRAAQAQEDQEGEIYVDEVPVVATGTAGSELGVKKGRGKGKGKGKAQAKGKAKGKGKAGAPNGREEASPSPAAAAQLEGSASASPAPVGPSSPSTSTTTAAAQKKQARATLKKMERFPCRGSLIINIHHDDVTCTFSINHFLHHAEYVDVVGNRLRGAKYHALPVNLNTTITAPVGSIELGTDLLEDGSTPNWLDRAEQTFVALSELVRELRGKRGGGEEEASRVLYERSEGCRSYRIAVLEALAKGGQGIPKPEAGSKPKTTPAAGGGRKKRKVDQVDGAVEEGSVVQGEGEEGGAAQGGGGGLDVQATAAMAMDLDLPIMDDLPDLPSLPGPSTHSHSHSHELSMEEAMGLDVRSLLASASAAASVSGLRHQLGDAGNGEDLTVDYSALQHEWMDPRLS